MKVALIADIHGNLAALEAVLTALDRLEPDTIVCLGDVAATGPQPRETLARLRGLGCALVMGNADAELLAPMPDAAAGDADGQRFVEMSRWAGALLDEEDRAFIRDFQPVASVKLPDGGELLCCHGSPRSFSDVIKATTPDDELEPMLSGVNARSIAGGHWHVRMLRTRGEQTLINPGSVGLAYVLGVDGSVRVPPYAEFALLSVTPEGGEQIDFHRVAYDQGATLRAMREVGMPHAEWCRADWG